MTGVAIRKLVKNYGGFTAVHGIDLDIAEGEFVVLLGPSGCGKTTTLRCIAGLEEISEGTISLGDRVVSSRQHSVAPDKRQIGMVFQSYAIWPHMTVYENVAFGLKLKKLSRQQVQEKVEQVLELVGLSGFVARGASQLSGGQMQRVALARAVVLEPSVLLFDEPLSNLDAKLREQMRFEIRQLQKRLGITAVYVTHDQQEAMVIADRVVLMQDGQIVQIGQPVEIYNRPVTLFGAEFIGLANLLRGKVMSIEGGRVKLCLANGTELVSSLPDSRLRVGGDVDIVCRPEFLKVSPTEIQGDNVFRVHVNGTFFLGNISDIYLQFQDLELRGQLSPPALWPKGQPVWMQLPPDNVIVLPREPIAATSSAESLAAQ